VQAGVWEALAVLTILNLENVSVSAAARPRKDGCVSSYRKCDNHITILPSAKAVDIENHLFITLNVQAVQQWKRKPLPVD
jgi:hypothetical protein